ncbi:protein apnoia [Uranotaenia lowii]|uniref:protein apnoia n=1 Tax=Uranotaenia lowii TaxID=190385 RepID=UPI002478E72B|nr:protein apnoia [Uranotaenia lowii]
MSVRSNIVVLVYIVLCCLLPAALGEQQDQQTVAESRTFGHHFLKRVSFAMIPAAFVVGVITTLLSALTVVSMKGLGVGVILLVLAVSQILARSFAAPLPPPPIAYAGHGHIPLVYH